MTINAELADELATYAMYTGNGLARIVEQAIWELLDQNRTVPSVPREPRVPTVPAVPVPRYVSDEKRFDDDEGISLLYEELTGNPFRDGDRRFLDEVRQYGMRTIATALFVGRGRYTKKINSMRFFHNNILEVAAWEPNKIDKELRYQSDMQEKRMGR